MAVGQGWPPPLIVVSYAVGGLAPAEAESVVAALERLAVAGDVGAGGWRCLALTARSDTPRQHNK